MNPYPEGEPGHVTSLCSGVMAAECFMSFHRMERCLSVPGNEKEKDRNACRWGYEKAWRARVLRPCHVGRLCSPATCLPAVRLWGCGPRTLPCWPCHALQRRVHLGVCAFAGGDLPPRCFPTCPPAVALRVSAPQHVYFSGDGGGGPFKVFSSRNHSPVSGTQGGPGKTRAQQFLYRTLGKMKMFVAFSVVSFQTRHLC